MAASSATTSTLQSAEGFVDDSVVLDEGTAEDRGFLGNDHAGAAHRRGPCRCKPGRPAADDEHVAEGVGAFVAIRVGETWGGPHAGGPANERLDQMPDTLADERLVVEAGAKRSNQTVDGHQVETERRPAILTCRFEPFEQLDHRRRRVWRAASAQPGRDQRRRLLRPGRRDAARPVILETAANQNAARGDKRGGERVSRKPGEAFTIETEVDVARAVDQPATSCQAIAAHVSAGRPHAPARATLAMACVAVSRLTTNQLRHPPT